MQTLCSFFIVYSYEDPVTEMLSYPNSRTIIYSKSNETLQYNYNEQGRVETVTSNKTGKLAFLYDPNQHLFAIQSQGYV